MIANILIFWVLSACISVCILLVALYKEGYRKGMHTKVPRDQADMISSSLICLPIPMLNIYKAIKYLRYIS